MSLISRSPRNKQPRGGIRPSAYWIERGLAFAITRADGAAFDVLNQKRPSSDSGTTTTNPDGVVTDYTGAQVTEFADASPYQLTGALTLIAGIDIDAFTNYTGIAFKQGTTTSNAPFEWRHGRVDATNGGPTSPQMTLIRASGSALSEYCATNGSTSTGRRIIAVSSADGSLATVPKFYESGRPLTVATASSTSGTVTNGGNLRLGQRTDGAVQLDGRLSFLYGFNRQLTDGEVAELSRNPWQLFIPSPRRIWVPAAASSDVTTALTGSAVTASAGTLAPSVSIPLTGQAATASAGTIAPSSSVPVSGQAATASAGTVSPTVTIALTGTAVTASAGTVTYSAGNNISLTLTGAEVTASAGNLGLSSTVPVSGSSAAASAGTLTPGTSVAVSGTSVTASAGTLTYSANQDLTLALTGEAVQVSAGTITVIGGVSAVAVTSGAPGPRAQRWVVYINGKRYIGSLQEIEQIVAEFAEEQAEKAQTAKPPKKPKIKVEPGRPVGVKPSETVKVQPEPEVQQQVRNIYAEAYARAIAQMELDEEEDIISLL